MLRSVCVCTQVQVEGRTQRTIVLWSRFVFVRVCVSELINDGTVVALSLGRPPSLSSTLLSLFSVRHIPAAQQIESRALRESHKYTH